ncbi:hypothetical protein RGR602_CH01500 [Rhizobium gallicum bv. gallicum R602sp]|uniref:Uncharacterized protein n=1 Tax=Rhizobium gallicum bv. gallicum R602sp TaxID=1041138 RepID=A0A0B4X2Q9_9HYPH|nr:hypothetical protein RGR602_CH01500 [Rhizobium gallicum bv. gallicum R602sp]
MFKKARAVWLRAFFIPRLHFCPISANKNAVILRDGKDGVFQAKGVGQQARRHEEPRKIAS